MEHSASQIGKVAEAITKISEQTHLPALNTTIEAARAGDAGKGFAVAVNEMKDLAKQILETTVDTRNKIDNMPSTTDATTADIEKISKVIEDIKGVITTIETTSEQQSAATSEIFENFSQTSAGIAEDNENVTQSTVTMRDVTKVFDDISQTAEEINTASGNDQGSATELSKLAEQLDNLVKRFKMA